MPDIEHFKCGQDNRPPAELSLGPLITPLGEPVWGLVCESPSTPQSRSGPEPRRHDAEGDGVGWGGLTFLSLEAPSGDRDEDNLAVGTSWAGPCKLGGVDGAWH